MADENEQTPTEGTPNETPSAPVPGTPEHDAAMAEKYQTANGTAPDPAEEENTEESSEENPDPSLTIKTGEENSEEESSEENTEEEPSEENAEGEEEEGSQESEAPALSDELFQTADTEFAETGELTDDTVAKFVKAGIPEKFVKAYEEGQRAIRNELVREAHSTVGGEENYNAMMEWAATLPEDDITAFNKTVVDPQTSALALQGLYSRFTAANGNEETSVTNDAERGTATGEVYNSKAEMTADIRDPKYKTDPAHRKAVAEKIERSRKAGTLGPLGHAY